MAHGKNITFEDDAKANVPFIQDYQADDKKIIDIEKSNYLTINSMEGGNLVSNYSTVTSCSSYYPTDTAILLHNKHKKYEEEQQREMRVRSLKGTICFILTILVVLALVGLAIASLYIKLANKDTNKQEDMDSINNGFNNTNSSFAGENIPLYTTLWKFLNTTESQQDS